MSRYVRRPAYCWQDVGRFLIGLLVGAFMARRRRTLTGATSTERSTAANAQSTQESPSRISTTVSLIVAALLTITFSLPSGFPPLPLPTGPAPRDFYAAAATVIP